MSLQKNAPWTVERAWEYALRPIQKMKTPHRKLLAEFATWLRDDRAMFASTIGVRLSSIRSFLEWAAPACGPVKALRRLTPADVELFFVSYRAKGKGGSASQRNMQSAMRLFLRFAAARGFTSPELVGAVPALYVYRLASTPRALTDEQIVAVLDSVDGDTASEVRDMAILLLLAAYGCCVARPESGAAGPRCTFPGTEP